MAVLLAGVSALPSLTQVPGRGAPALETPRPGQTISQGTTGTYFDLPEPRLKKVVSELKGLQFEASQDQLPAILASVAKTIADLLPRLPDLVSREEIYHSQDAHNPQPWSREFKYLVLCHHNPNGSTNIEESRLDSKGHPIDLSGPMTTQHGFGFAYQWLLFSAANQREFHFRYLGQQDKEGRKTFVVAFAQDPSKVTAPASFQLEQTTAPFYYQGVLWIDQATSDIVLMRTDLLSPIASLQLSQFTSRVHFASVAIHGYDAVFWLPHEIDISFDQGRGDTEETHRYTDYHLFHAEARVLPEQ